jgi:hypothetical protein
MIKNLIELLEVARGESENIRIAQGKYYLPETFKDTIKQIKKEYRCLNKS